MHKNSSKIKTLSLLKIHKKRRKKKRGRKKKILKLTYSSSI